MASRRPSPIRLIQMVHAPKITAGNTHLHHYCWITTELFAPLSRFPHVGVGSGMPKPR